MSIDHGAPIDALVPAGGNSASAALGEAASPALDEYGQHETYPKLFIASHCHETIHAFESAKRKMGKDGSIKDDYTEFKTGHEGLLDAIRYALVAIFKERQGMQIIRGL
jgi:hypothetical protein